MIFLNNLLKVLMIIKKFEIISIIIKTFVITKINENFIIIKNFDIVKNVEKSLLENFKHKKDFV